MRRATLALITATIGACQMLSGLDEYGIDAETASSKGGGGQDNGTTIGGAAGSTTAGGQGGENGGGGQGGTAPIPVGCADIGPPSGIQVVDPDGQGGNPPLDVYCEQGIAGGGWTLIGRSAPGGTGNMGWRVNRGSVSATQNPYSLDVIAAKLVFSSLLLVGRDGGVQAYTIDVPSNFVTDHAASNLDVSADVLYVQGSCMPNNGWPTMLRHAGYTDNDQVFFFRDVSSEENYGLFADRFAVAYMTCDEGGGLNDDQGEIYVR